MGIGCLAPNKKNQSVVWIMNLTVQFFVETFVGMAIGYFLGSKLDEWLLNDQVIFTYIFLIFGLFSGLFSLIKRVLNKINGEKKDEENEHN